LPAVTALVTRRQEIMREQAYLEKEARRCEEALVHIDATIRLFDPTYDFTVLKAKKFYTEDEIFRPGEAPLLAFDILREADGPMTIPQIARAMLEKRGAPRVTAAQFRSLNAKLNSALNMKFRQGAIKKVGKVADGVAILWAPA